MALIEDFNEKAKRIIQNDSATQNSEEDETIEIIEFDVNSKEYSNLETFVIDGDVLVDNEPNNGLFIDDSILGGQIIGDDEVLTEVVTEGMIDSTHEISDEDLKEYLNDDVDYIG